MKRMERRGFNPVGFDRAQRVNHQRGVAAVIERAGAQFPGIQMRAENDEFVGLFAAFDFRDHVGGLDRATELIGDAQIGPHRMPGGQQASDSLSIFPRHQNLRNAIDFSRKRIGVPVENVVLARSDEGYSLGLALHGSVMTGGAFVYSAKRSSQVFSTTDGPARFCRKCRRPF